MIQKILDKIIKFINWPYAVGGKQAIIEKRLFKLCSMMPATTCEKIFFKDGCDVEHSLVIDNGVYPLTDACIFVQHHIFIKDEENLPDLKRLEKPLIEYPVDVEIELFQVSKEGNSFYIDKIDYSSMFFCGSKDPEYEKYRDYNLFYHGSTIDYEELAKQLDLLMIKLL